MASLASSGIRTLSSLLARSWSRKALRVLRKSAAKSAQEFDEVISTMRTASMRGRGGSALIMRRFAGLHAAPEFLFRRDQDTSMGIVISTPLPPPVMIESTEVLK